MDYFNHEKGASDFFSDESTHGIIPRSIADTFRSIEETSISEGVKYTVYCSFLQIYNEKLYDLLQDAKTLKPLTIREESLAGIYVEGLTEYVVMSPRDCFALLKRGERNRITRATKANMDSSRSHSIF